MKKVMTVLSLCLGLSLLTLGCGEIEDDLDGGSGSDAGSADSGPVCPSGVGGPCGAYTEYGECNGDLLIWCDEANDQLHCDDCAGQGGAFHCALFNTGYGYDCLGGLNDNCSADFPVTVNPPGCDPAIATCTGGTCQ